jgi:NADH:ubiquinone oxidoreductase subunit F (NADH-binding)
MNILHSQHYIYNTDQFANAGLDQYKRQGGFSALKRVLSMDPDEAISIIKYSELRGRGGAAFPTGKKIEMVRSASGDVKYLICNADEGEPGTFKDRFIMTHFPFQLIEGIIIAAYMAGASKGIVYVRHEYPEAQKILKACIASAQNGGYLGNSILGSGFSFTIELFSGAGSYLCGEETAMISSIEGKKGRPRLKPPYPTQSGLWNKPTLINNVETLSTIPRIIEKGAEWFRSIGTEDSRGTKLISLSGDVTCRGLCEVPFGVTFREIIEKYGKGVANGRKIKAVNIGGASGVLIPSEMLDTPMEYGTCAKAGITIGSGAIFVLDETRSILANVHNRVKFFLHENCGKCTPCREGLRQANAILSLVLAGKAKASDIDALERYTRAMQDASFCGLGQAAGNSLISSLSYYRDEYLSYCKENQAPQEETA